MIKHPLCARPPLEIEGWPYRHGVKRLTEDWYSQMQVPNVSSFTRACIFFRQATMQRRTLRPAAPARIAPSVHASGVGWP